MSIRQELKRFDGKNIDALEEILARHPRAQPLIGSLVTLASDEEPKIQAAATWLLKRLAEDHVNFKPEHLTVLFGSLPELNHWISKLHVCQMLGLVRIPAGSESNISWFLDRNLWDENRFLRAWSYNGFYELARQHKQYLAYAMEQLERGETDKAASVKARIRNIRKELNKLPGRN